MYDVAIIGGGPAGVAAGVYASRKQLKTVFITDSYGGQSTVSSGIQNWIGTIEISGEEFGESLRKHLAAYAGDVVDIHDTERVTHIEESEGGFSVTTDKGNYKAKTVLIATGSYRRKLDIPGAEQFEHKGITYCASCDGPLFSGMDVAVIGGGNAGFETAAQLLAYTKTVTLIHRGDSFKADPVTVEKVLAHPNMKALTNSQPVEVQGEKFVTGLVVLNTVTQEKTELPVQGIFVEIGLIPSTEYVKGIVNVNDYGQITIDPRTQRTSNTGIWAAGDCTDVIYHQNNIAAGDAVRAIEDLYMYIKTRS